MKASPVSLRKVWPTRRKLLLRYAVVRQKPASVWSVLAVLVSVLLVCLRLSLGTAEHSLQLVSATQYRVWSSNSVSGNHYINSKNVVSLNSGYNRVAIARRIEDSRYQRQWDSPIHRHKQLLLDFACTQSTV